ncbi:MAG TPA: low molecular weight phosphatase family protein [Aestuariivirgaceae bacterium]|nr:low molecular weight phosphatase family protein [Aestuariivirgaceae bacterium]
MAGDLPGAVLFACSLNAIRSPMAAALTRHFYGHKFYVASCGVRAGEPDPFAIAVMDELGIDMARHRPQSFEDLSDDSFDLIVSLSPEAHHWAVELTRTMALEAEYWPTMDPSLAEGSREQKLDAYRDVRDDLRRRLLARFGSLGAGGV